jgi:hypothetical protein
MILVYAIFYFGIFTFAMIWRFQRIRLKNFFHLLDDHSTMASSDDVR